MSRFSNDDPEDTEIAGTPVGGAFACQSCDKVSTAAVNNRQEEMLYWKCPEGHLSSIPFKN